MTSFFEKLKKGMGVKAIPEEEELTKEEVKKLEEEIKKETKRLREEIKKAPSKKSEVVQELSSEEKKTRGKKKETKKKRGAKRKPKKTRQETKEKIVVREEKPEESVVKKTGGWLEPEGQLTIDLYQTEKDIVIRSAIAGVRAQQLDISIENDVVTIKGFREEPPEQEKKDYFYQECYWGAFSRKIILPVEVDPSRIQAKIKNGILIIRIPKIEREKRRRVIIKEE